MRVFLDANVILDDAIPRPAFEDDANRVLRWCEANADSTLIAHHTATTIYYLLRNTRNDGIARGYLSRMLQWIDVAPASKAQLTQTMSFVGGDAEDQLQCVSARDGRADMIVTRDADFPGEDFSGIPTFTPVQFMIDRMSELIDAALHANVIQQRGSWFHFPPENISIQGRTNLKHQLIVDEALSEQVRNALEEISD